MRLLFGYTHEQVGKYLCITGTAYGRIERNEIQPSHSRINQLAALYKIDPQVLTNEQDLCLQVCQSPKGELQLSAEPDAAKLIAQHKMLEEENTRLRDMIADLKYLNEKQKELIDRLGR